MMREPCLSRAYGGLAIFIAGLALGFFAHTLTIFLGHLFRQPFARCQIAPHLIAVFEHVLILDVDALLRGGQSDDDDEQQYARDQGHDQGLARQRILHKAFAEYRFPFSSLSASLPPLDFANDKRGQNNPAAIWEDT